MSAVFREVERQERRVLGAVEFVDATTGARITSMLAIALVFVSTGGALPRPVRNPSGLWVLRAGGVLADHGDAFLAPPAAPPPGDVAVDAVVSDPAGEYVPRAFRLALPRDPDPARRGQPDSLFTAHRVELMRAARAPLGANWSRLDVSVADADSGDALGGALVEVRDTGGALLARGITDWRGEAVVPVAGVPITTWADGPGDVVATAIDVQVRAFFLPSAGLRTPQAQVDAGRPPALPTMPDPDRMAGDAAVRAGDPQTLSIAAQRARAVRLVVALA